MPSRLTVGAASFHNRSRLQGMCRNPIENQLPDLMEVYRKAREYYDSGQNTP